MYWQELNSKMESKNQPPDWANPQHLAVSLTVTVKRYWQSHAVMIANIAFGARPPRLPACSMPVR
jgi:hypothetical protein